MLQRLLELFLDGTPALISEIREGLAQGDAKTVADRAHALKGSALGLGANTLGGLAAELEKAGKAGDLAAAGSLLEPVERAFDAAREAARPELAP